MNWPGWTCPTQPNSRSRVAWSTTRMSRYHHPPFQLIDEINLSLNNKTFFLGVLFLKWELETESMEEDEGAFAGFIVENADNFLLSAKSFLVLPCVMLFLFQVQWCAEHNVREILNRVDKIIIYYVIFCVRKFVFLFIPLIKTKLQSIEYITIARLHHR